MFAQFWRKKHTFVTFLQWQIWFPQAASHHPWLLALLQIIQIIFMWESGESAVAAVINKHLKSTSENMHQKCKLWIYGRNQTAYLSKLPALHHLPSLLLHPWSNLLLESSGGHRSRTAPAGSKVVMGPSPCTLPHIGGSWISPRSFSGRSCDRVNKNMMKVDYGIKLYYNRHLNGWGLW